MRREASKRMSEFDINKYLSELEEIVNIDSGSVDFHGHEILADWFEKKFLETGLSVERYMLLDFEGRGVRPYLFASNRKLPEESRGERDIDVLFIGHLDTVFPQGTVQQRPFSMDGDVAKGPGVADMKSGCLLALYIVQELMNEYPGKTFAIAHNFDEELGSVDSGLILQMIAGRSKWVFDMEPGRITGNMVKARKDVDEYEVIFHGIPSHAGNSPEQGASAINEMAHFIMEAHKLNDYERGLTVSVGTCSGGTTTNVIPEHAMIRMDVRYWRKEDRQEIVGKLQELADRPATKGVRTEIRQISCLPPMEPSSKTLEMMRVITEEAEKLGMHIEFESSAGGSDGSLAAETGAPVLDACGPAGDGLHNEKEFIRISSVQERYMLILNAVRRLLEE